MGSKPERYMELRSNGSDPVGAFGARRITREMRKWVADEAARTGRTQRAVMEDILESFIRHRRKCGGKFPYENLPRNSEKTFRMSIKFDLLQEALKLVEEDGIFNGDLVNAAIKYEISKNSNVL